MIDFNNTAHKTGSPQIQKLYNLKQVCELTGKKRSTIYNWMRTGNFPQSIKIGPNSIAWPSSAIAAWQESKLQEAV